MGVSPSVVRPRRGRFPCYAYIHGTPCPGRRRPDWPENSSPAGRFPGATGHPAWYYVYMSDTDTSQGAARKAALLIRAGADPARYHVNGVLPDAILDQILDLAAKGL